MRTIIKSTNGANLRQNLECLNSKPSHSILLQILFSLLIIFFSLPVQSQDIKTIAITEIVAHPSLEQAKLGIIDELKAQGFEVGKNLKIIEENAQGNIANASLIAKKFVSIKPDVIIPISTPSAQTVFKASKGSGIPIVFSSVTDPIAAGLVKNLSDANPDITGVIDFPPINEEIMLIEALIGEIKTIGIIYNPGEANSTKTVKLLKEAIGQKWKIIEAPSPSSNFVAEATRSLIGKVDAIYIPSDNTVFSAMAKLVQITQKNKLPLFSSDPDSVKQGVLACYGYTQYAVGRAAGKLTARILNGEKTIGIIKPHQAEIFVNKRAAKKLGLQIPKSLINLKVKIVE